MRPALRAPLFVVALLMPAALAAQRNGSSPASGDTLGYWQQRANYDIIARLDEARQTIVATGTLRYTNNSPDVLTEMFVHQYLNAFRPYSKWSDTDEREGRTRFQLLEDPAFGFERFTARPTVAPYLLGSTLVRSARTQKNTEAETISALCVYCEVNACAFGP